VRQQWPNASFIGFTGTPIEREDRDTQQVFGSYIDIYDIAQAVDDGATVRIFYESRLAKINLSDAGKKLVEELDEHLANEDLSNTQKAKTKWTQLEALIGSEDRVEQIASDIITHNVDGILIEEGDIVSLSEALQVLIDDEQERIQLGREALKIRKRLDVGVIMSKWEQQISNLNLLYNCP